MTENSTDPQTIADAMLIIGVNKKGNRDLEAEDNGKIHIARIEAFAQKYPAAAALVNILKSPSIRSVYADYHEMDEKAGDAQHDYIMAKRWTVGPLIIAIILAIIAIFIPSEFVANLLAKWNSPEYVSTRSCQLSAECALFDKYIRHLMPVMVYFFLLATPIMSWRNNPKPHFKRWMQSRALAESLRRELFDRIFAATTSSASIATPLLQLKLEYFRRYQIELQRAYFDKRQEEHETLSNWTSCFHVIYIVIAIVAGLVMALGVFSSLEEQLYFVTPEWLVWFVSPLFSWLMLIGLSDLDRWLLIGSIGLAATYGILLYHTVLKGSVRNAARFAVMKNNLKDFENEYLPMARDSAASGDKPAVMDFIKDVHSVMSLELSDWVRIGDLERGRETKTYRNPKVTTD